MTLLFVDGLEGELVRLEHPDGSMLVVHRSWLPGKPGEVGAYSLVLEAEGRLLFSPCPEAARASVQEAASRLARITELPPSDFKL